MGAVRPIFAEGRGQLRWLIAWHPSSLNERGDVVRRHFLRLAR